MEIDNKILNWVFKSLNKGIINVALTPTPHDDKMWAKVYKYLEVLALAIGKAKDKNPLLDK